MRRLTIIIMTALLSLTALPVVYAGNAHTTVSKSMTKPAETAVANNLLGRLDEINAMDKQNLSISEKRELRKEVRSIQKQLKEMGGGVYLSVGAIIIIILLLILLL